MSHNPPKIHIAFRFHTNFYHSYRGDTPDELGFGLDIRVIRRIIEVLNGWNERGVPVKGTWDIENAFSLEDIMPKYCPDIITSLQQRVRAGYDEIEVMAYNNGLISAHTAVEFDEAISKALHNKQKSGLCDIFDSVAPVVRPQEMMYTPLHLKLYPAHGISVISLFYSGVPFNTLSNFIKPLPLAHRYNPLWLTYPELSEKLTLCPAYNHGDIADWLSLRRWVIKLHKKQMQLADPPDFLLLIDADADDEYWYGYNWPVIRHLLSITQGLDGLIRSVYDLPYVVFTTPYTYLEDHPPLATVQVGQDTADGSFDGYASWADKWSNHQLWTGIERSRIMELQALRLASEIPIENLPSQFQTHLSASNASRLRALSTTHFGLTAPILNRTRLTKACELVSTAVRDAGFAYRIMHQLLAQKATSEISFSLYNYKHGVDTPRVFYEAKPSQALIQLSVKMDNELFNKESMLVSLKDDKGNVQPACVQVNEMDGKQLLFVAKVEKSERIYYTMTKAGVDDSLMMQGKPVSVSQHHLQNQWLTLKFNDSTSLVNLVFADQEFTDGGFVRSAVNYAGRVSEVLDWHISEVMTLGGGYAGVVRVNAEIPLKTKGKPCINVEHEFHAGR